MLKNELEKLLDKTLTSQEYDIANTLYMNTDMDKAEFAKVYADTPLTLAEQLGKRLNDLTASTIALTKQYNEQRAAHKEAMIDILRHLLECNESEAENYIIGKVGRVEAVKLKLAGNIDLDVSDRQLLLERLSV